MINELSCVVKNFTNQEKYVVILMDEMKIQEDLVWDKHTGDLIGYVDLGNTELNYATLKKSDEVASHVLVFLVGSIVNPMKFTLANFGTKNVTALQLFPLFWKAVGILEDKCKLAVVAVTSDGASSNRTFYRMHSKLQKAHEFSCHRVVYKTLNTFSDEVRYIYFICDPPHIIKTARNNLSHSSFGKSSRLLWNDGYFLTWDHISRIVSEDLECGRMLCPKLSSQHINLTPYSVMNVRLPTQILSNSVSVVLKNFGPPDATATAVFCDMFDKFVDCLNVRNTMEHVTKQKPFLKPYTSVDDERFSWLLNTFLRYFENWKVSTQNMPGCFSNADIAKMFISWPS